MSAIVLLSGGMDSTIALFHTLNQKHGTVHAISIYYGQRHSVELQHARMIVSRAQHHYTNFGDHILVKADGFMPRVGSLMDFDMPVTHYKGPPPSGSDSSFIPHRNLLFMVIAAMWARKLNVSDIVLGVRGGFPDCTPEFIQHATQLLYMSSGENRPLHISSPVHMSRTRSILLARGLPGCFDALSHSLTCFEGAEPPCGSCLPCIKRAEGFAELGIADPLIERVFRPRA